MAKVHVVTIDEVSDYVNYPHTPQVFTKKEKALEYLKDMYESADNELDSDLIREFSKYYAEIYEDGCFCTEHWTITLDEVEVIE